MFSKNLKILFQHSQNIFISLMYAKIFPENCLVTLSCKMKILQITHKFANFFFRYNQRFIVTYSTFTLVFGNLSCGHI
jgi:hypothetical protein